MCRAAQSISTLYRENSLATLLKGATNTAQAQKAPSGVARTKGFLRTDGGEWSDWEVSYWVWSLMFCLKSSFKIILDLGKS